MSKAEERSKEIMQASLDYANNLDDIKPTDEFRRNLCISLGQAFMKGAEWADEHQAEKDLALTWEDINRIEIIIKDVYRDYPHGIEVRQFGVEVLNRFNKIKGD